MIRIVAVLALMAAWSCRFQTSQAGGPDATGASVDREVALPEGWRWDRPVADHAKCDGDAIRLRTESGRIWAGEGNENRIMTSQPIGESAEVQAEVELVNAVGKWEQCGLLVYQHDDSFVKLVVEHIDGVHFVVMAREVEDKRKVLAKIEIPGARALLCLRVKGSNVIGVWRTESSQAWKPASETDLDGTTNRHFAVFSQDGDPSNPRDALVRGLRYTKPSAP